jgi:hypothetical protein
MLAPFESAFAKALLDSKQPIPVGIGAPGAVIPTRRLAVHRNNMIAGLVNVLKGRFPVVEKIVGEEFFGAMAGAFVRECPPRSPVLASYGDELPEFIAAFAPARDLAYLADVARLEAAHTRAHHAADVAPLDATAFATLDSSAINSIRLKLHPSVEIVRSSHPIVTIWAMNSGALTLAPIEDWRGEDALVARPHLEVEVRLLSPGGAAFLHALAAGRPLGAAAERALAECPQFDLTGNLAGLIGWGLARRIVLTDSSGPALP